MNPNTRAVVKAVNVLNLAYEQDPSAIWTLMNTYTKCNEIIADHPTVQVLEKEVEGKKEYSLGFLGLLNGVIEEITGEKVCIRISDEDDKGQRKILGFDVFTKDRPKIITPSTDLV